MINLKELAEMLEKEGIKCENMTNGNRAGLAIGNNTVKPVIYADKFDDLNEALEFARYLAGRPEPTFTETLFDRLYDTKYVRENVRLGIRPAADDGVLTRPFFDLQVYTYVNAGDSENERYMVSIGPAHAEGLNLSEAELFGHAVFNTCYDVKPITQVMKEILVKEGLNEQVAEMIVSLSSCPMYVITTPDMFRGASAMVNNLCMYELAETLDSDLIIFPSSVHEVIVVPGDTDTSMEKLQDIVRTINLNEVEPKDVLSNHVYKFCRHDGKVRMAI